MHTLWTLFTAYIKRTSYKLLEKREREKKKEKKIGRMSCTKKKSLIKITIESFRLMIYSLIVIWNKQFVRVKKEIHELLMNLCKNYRADWKSLTQCVHPFSYLDALIFNYAPMMDLSIEIEHEPL